MWWSSSKVLPIPAEIFGFQRDLGIAQYNIGYLLATGVLGFMVDNGSQPGGNQTAQRRADG